MQLRGLGKAMAVATVIVFCASQALAGPARLVRAEGKVWITPPQGQETLASAGNQLEAGTRIRTGADGQAELRFENGSVLRVRPNTSMSLSGNKRKRKKSSIVLFFGRLWSKVTSTKSRDFEVKTPNGVAGVRGTEFETAVGADGSIRIVVHEGVVLVGEEDDYHSVERGQQIDGDERGITRERRSDRQARWEAWEANKRERLRKSGRSIVNAIKTRIMSRKAKLETLRARQQAIEKRRADAERRARMGDRRALNLVRQYNEELAEIADAIADIGDETDSQFGLVDHFADLANDPRFGMVDRKYLVSQAKSLRRIKASLDRMVADGTDISMKAMDNLLDDMGSGRGGGLLDKEGSSKDDLFGDDPF